MSGLINPTVFSEKKLDKNINNFQNIITNENSVVQVPIKANDVVFNSNDQKLYVSRPSDDGIDGNSITTIDPRSGDIGDSVFVGSEPDQLALSGDGQTLYVALDGAFSIRRYNTVTQTAGVQFSVGVDDYPNTVYKPNDIAIAPNNPNILAVTRHKPGISPPDAGVAIYNNGVQLPNITPKNDDGADFLAFSDSDETLYGSGNYIGLQTMTVNASGVTVTNESTQLSARRIKYDDGLIFSSNGKVIQPETDTLLGTFPITSFSIFEPDSSIEKAFYASRDGSSIIIEVFDINTFISIGSISIPNVFSNPKSITRYGTNGLALTTTDNKLFLIQTSLIDTQNPEPIPTISPTPTPTPTIYSSFIREISLQTNDLIYDKDKQKIYASVPSSATENRGNSVTTINPINGEIENSIFVGSEPNLMTISNDSKTLYVGIDGAGSVRKIDLINQTAGLQFPLENSSSGPNTVKDIEIMPNTPNTVAISHRYSFNANNISIYDQGIKRPLSSESSGPIEFFRNNILYSGSGEIDKNIIYSTGITTAGSFPSASSGDMKLINDIIYTASGRVIDAVTEDVMGTFSGVEYQATMTVDVENNRAFFLSDSPNVQTISAYNINTYRLIGKISVPRSTYDGTSLIRWGTNGLALRNRYGKVFLIQTDLVNDSKPIPTPTPTISPTPTPSPINVPTFMRSVSIPVNDLVYSSSTQSLHLSVPSSGGVGLGNTITRVNPINGSIESSTFVGSEPNILAISDDGETLYSRLDGAGAIRRFDIPTETPGMQFIPNGLIRSVEDIEVQPNNPQTVALGTTSNGVLIYDNGVKRPNTDDAGLYSVNSIEFADSSTIYGYNNDTTGFELARFDVDENGVEGNILGSNLISGFSVQINYANGLLFASSGRVLNPSTLNLIGTFRSNSLAMTVDPELNRVFFLNENVLTAYDSNTFLKIGTATLPDFPGYPASLVRWGENGLAFHTRNSSNPENNQLYILQSYLVSNNLPIPTGIQVSTSSLQKSEGSSSDVAIKIIRTGDIANSSIINYTTVDGTAIGGEDYTETSGVLKFDPGETIKTINIPLINDNIFEGSETFSLEITKVAGSNVEILNPSAAEITIRDNDNRPFFTSTGEFIPEPPITGSTSATISLNLSNPTTQTVSVNFSTRNGTAIAGSDYIATSGTLTFAPLETSKEITVQILGDNINESNEDFFIDLSNPVNASNGIGQIRSTILNYNPQTARHTRFDFDGDGKSDISVFRPSERIWHINQSQNGYGAFQFGLPDDKPVPADYDGDGKADIAVYREGIWFIQRSALGFSALSFGLPDDIPQAADYNGDGRSEIAVFRPSDGLWYIYDLENNEFNVIQWGISTDKPVVGDYDGDGKADPAIFRPNEGLWYILGSSQGFFTVRFGLSEDVPVVGDYDGDGKTDQALFRPSNGVWYLLRSTDGFIPFQFGVETDLPTPGDYDGDNKTNIAIFRDGNWFILNNNQSFIEVPFGLEDDKPIPNSVVPQ